VDDVLKGTLRRIAGADFFTTEVWTWRGLVTYYTVFVIDLASRRVDVLGSTPHPTELFMEQTVRMVTAADDGLLVRHRVLICDRDRKWSAAVRRRFAGAGIRVVLTPERAPNANAYAERFVRSIKEECLDRMIPLGERHFRHALKTARCVSSPISRRVREIVEWSGEASCRSSPRKSRNANESAARHAIPRSESIASK
jgi:transposase InsO family protein